MWSLEDSGDVAVIIATIAALITIPFLFRQLHHQARVRDFENFLEVKREISVAWEKYITCKPENREFYFGELLSTYESMCYLSNKKIIGRKARELLVQHIIEVILRFLSDESSLAQMKKLASGRDTYSEIIEFWKTHKKMIGDHWRFVQETGWIDENG